MDKVDIRIYFTLPTCDADNIGDSVSQSDHDHVGCQHFLSKPPRAGSEAEKSRSEGVNSGSKLREALRNSLNASNLGSRKLVFLHGSKRDFIQTRVGSTLECSGHIEYVSDAVKKIPLSVSEDPQSWNREEEEENHINIFHRLLFEGRIFYAVHLINCIHPQAAMTTS